jgi:hypothetical protein
MSRENLERVLDKATEADWEIASEAWFRYHRIVAAIAGRYGFSVETGAAVFSALSPNSDYLGNLRDTNRLLGSAAAHKAFDQFTVSTYGANKRKAWRIVHGERPLDLIVAPKTRNFFLNVYNPLDPVPVTVDGHIFNAWNGKRMPLNSAGMKGNQKHYEEVANVIRQLGSERKILPNVLQGLVWYTWKRMHGIKLSSQLEFWGPDYLASGLGFELEQPVSSVIRA